MGLARTNGTRRVRQLIPVFACVFGAATFMCAPGTFIEGQRQAHAAPLVVGAEAWLDRLTDPLPATRAAAVWAIGRFTPPGGALARRVGLALQSNLRREPDLATQLATVAALDRLRLPALDATLRELGLARASAEGLPPVVALSALRLRVARHDPTDALMVFAERAQPASAPLPGDDTAWLAARALASLPHAAFARAISLLQQSGPPHARVGVLRAVGLRGDPRWGHLVLAALQAQRGPRPAVAVDALDAAARLRLAEAADIAIELARSTEVDPAVRRAATRTLASLGGAFDPAVLRALVDDVVTRAPALDALGALGDREAVAAVTPLLDAPWTGDRLAAAETLARLGDRGAARAITARLAREDDRDVRRALWRALAHLGGAAAAPLAHDDALARWALAEARVTGSADRTPVYDGSRVAPDLMLDALSGRVVDVSLCRADDADQRHACAMALGYGEGGDARVGALAATIARDDDEGVRVAAVVSLERIAANEGAASASRGAACDALVAVLASDPELRGLPAIAALSSLGSLRVYAARDLAARAAGRASAPPLARRVALYAAGALGATSARLAVERTLAIDAEPSVRGAAALALAALVGRDALAVLAEAAATASTMDLASQIDLAQARAAASDRVEALGDAVVRGSGAAPRSVWTLTRPDGRVLFGVAAGDGELFIANAWRAEPGDLAPAP